MKKALILIPYLLISYVAHTQEYDSKTYQSYSKARQIFNKCLEHGRYTSIDSLDFTIEGKWYHLGHYNVPKKRKLAHLKETITLSSVPYVTIQLNGEAVLVGKTYHKNEYIAKDSLSFKDYGEKITHKPSEINEKSDILLLSPITLCNDIQANLSSLRYIDIDEDNHHVLSYTSSSNKQISVHIHSNNFTMVKSEVLSYDNSYGDFLNTYTYQNYSVIEGFNVPTELIIKEWDVVKKEMKYQYNNIVENKSPSHCENYVLKEIGEGFYSIKLSTWQHRVFIIDFKNFLGIIKAPISDAYSNCIYNIIQQKFPNKELRYLFLTHHHPDHAGGFGYFFKKGSTVVSTAMSIAFFKELLDRKHSIHNQFSFNLDDYGKFEVVYPKKHKTIKTSKNSVEIYEFGDYSLHTSEFLLYCLPKQKSLIVSDLWRVVKGKTYPSKRALNIYNFIESNNLKVDRIYQTWPLYGYKEYGSIEDLKKSSELQKNK